MAALLHALFACADPVRAGLEQDARVADRIAAAATAAEVRELAETIGDPVIHDASVIAWAADHAGRVPLAEGKALCGSLLPQNRTLCERRLTAAHLNR